LILSYAERDARTRIISARQLTRKKKGLMKKRKSDSEDSLRPHYDLDKLEVVAYGPGWASSRLLRRYDEKTGLPANQSGHRMPREERK
jgi:hypothetical protein